VNIEVDHAMPQPLEPETCLGGYELVRRIGVGGMAEVWVARRVSERKANKYVAIKVVADQHVGDPRFQRMFKTEVELSALLNHVNIVQVFDEGEDDGRSYLVMEWVDGVNLLKLEAALSFIDDEPWRLKIITYVVGQLLYALHYAHSITLHDGNPLGIVHRDVSPQNVLVSAQGEVKLTDFGVAHYLLEESSGIHVKGKLRYMAPEQLAGRTRDPRLDLYAVGAILHELLDGRRFRHHVEDQRQMYIEVLSGQIPALSRSVPPELEALRLGLLEPDPERRLACADAALERLARFPGYGDARRELTQLCGGLTGVLRPRIGPGQSDLVPAATPSRAAAGRAEPPVAIPLAVGAAGPAEAAGAARSKTLRMAGAAAPEALEIDPTQPWNPVGVPGTAPTSTSARLRALAEATEPVAPVAREASTSPRAHRRPVAPWVLLGGVLAVVLGSGVWWSTLERPRSAATVPVTEPLPGSADAGEVAEVARAEEVRAAIASDGSDGSDGSDRSVERDPAAGSEETGDEPTLVIDDSTTTDATSTGQPSEPAMPAAGDPTQPPPPPPRPKQALSLVAVEALGAVQVEVRSKDGEFRRVYELHGRPKGERIPTGTYWVKWRSAGAKEWSKRERVVLRRGCDLRIVLAPTGMKQIPMGSTCR
jgi:cytoskeletal protein RodZ/tRNA A-37 threonylcarbamoyl transferase component Bud32